MNSLVNIVNEITFYEVASDVNKAVIKLLEKSYASSKKAIVYSPIKERIEALNDVLWTYSTSSFLPHGTSQAEHQPIFLTNTIENLNSAEIGILIDSLNVNEWRGLLKRIFVVCIEGNSKEAMEICKLLKGASYWKQLGEWVKVI